MTDIPEDILKVASAIVNDSSRYDSVGDFFRDDMVNDIARAILAERQACEKIAMDSSARFDDMAGLFGVSLVTEGLRIAGLISKRSS